MKQTRVWRERIYEKTSHDIKASLDDRHASIASGRVSGSSARVSAQHIRRHTRLTAAVTGERRPRDRPRAPRTTRHSRGYKLVSRLFPRYCEQKGSLPSRCPEFFQSYQFGLRGRGYETDSDTALLCAPERSPSRPNRVDVLDSHVKRPDVSTSGYSGKPRSSSPGTKSGMMRMIGHPLLGE